MDKFKIDDLLMRCNYLASSVKITPLTGEGNCYELSIFSEEMDTILSLEDFKSISPSSIDNLSCPVGLYFIYPTSVFLNRKYQGFPLNKENNMNAAFVCPILSHQRHEIVIRAEEPFESSLLNKYESMSIYFRSKNMNLTTVQSAPKEIKFSYRNLEQRVVATRSEEERLMEFLDDVLKNYTRGSCDESFAIKHFRSGFSCLFSVLANQEYQPEKKSDASAEELLAHGRATAEGINEGE